MGRHFLEVYGGLDYYNYSNFSRLNLTDWKVGGDGRYDASRAAVFSANAYYGEFHESLSSQNTVGFQASPNRYFQTHADVAGSYQPNRLGVGIGASYDRFDFTNTPRIGGGLLFNTDRDETQYQGYAKVFYNFSPGYSAFVKGLYESRQFDQFFDRTGRHRSSTGYRVDAGVDLEITHLVTGQIFVGYLEQHFSQSVPLPLKNISGIDYGVNLDWFALPVLTVHLNGARTISDTTLAGVSASEDSAIKLSADYEFRYNILVQGFFSYTHSDLIGSTRTDDYPSAGIGVKYLLNRYLSADINYVYGDRSSNFAGVNYTDNTISIGLTAHL
ncbi:MAG: outer membrane beta-barrel protein [Rhizomicrobium sp.]